MILIQIAIGGITRLTGSGLSITKWEIVTGTLPPFSESEWIEVFDTYRETPQYAKINKGMSMSQFKFIYFWEYFHRLWARLVGFVFFIPFVYFLIRRYLDKNLIINLLGAFFFGGLVGLFGWIMVQSGLVNRPWVNAYKLSVHLGLGVLLWCYLIYITASYMRRIPGFRRVHINVSYRSHVWMMILVFLQIILGGLMSGMKASLFIPTWPDYHDAWIPTGLLDRSMWSLDSFKYYDASLFVPGLVQFLHRNVAYLIVILYIIHFMRYATRYQWVGLLMILLQVLLGILTLIGSIGEIPLLLGVCHQLLGISLLGYLLFLYILRRPKILAASPK